MSKVSPAFELDYETTRDKMRWHWRHLNQYDGLFMDAFHDTWADYLEFRHEIQDSVSHIAWFRTRMWNNVNMYEPFLTRRKEMRGTQSVMKQHGECISDMLDLIGSDDNVVEQQAIIEQEIMLHFSGKYPKLPNEPPCIEYLRQGYDYNEVADILGTTYAAVWQSLYRYKKELNNGNEDGTEDRSS